MATDIEKEFAVHEAVCAERYRIITERLESGAARMTRIEYILYAVGLLVLFGPGVAASFVKHLLNL